MIANKNDHLWRLIERKRRAMATISSHSASSYDVNAYDEDGLTPSIVLSCMRNLSCVGCSAREMLMSTKA